jgi:hypothetical protein
MIDEWISLRWERGTRYYEVYLHQDLWPSQIRLAKILSG